MRLVKAAKASPNVLPMAPYCCSISSKGAVLLGRNDAEMSPVNSLHALAYYNEYKEKFDFDLIKLNDN